MNNLNELKRFIKSKITNILKEEYQTLSFKNLVNKKFPIEIGSGTITELWTESELLEKIVSVIKHNLFDSDFYYNWTNNKEEYLNSFNEYVLKDMIKNIDETLNKFFVFKKTPYSTNTDVLVFNLENTKNWIDKWFQESPFLSKELKKDYYDYRKQYAGVDLINP